MLIIITLRNYPKMSDENRKNNDFEKIGDGLKKESDFVGYIDNLQIQQLKRIALVS